MNIYLRNTLAVIAAFVIGSVVNMAIIMVGGIVVPLPPGVDPSNMDSIKASIHLFEAKHFIVPLIAHSVEGVVGGLAVSFLGGSRRLMLAMIVGVFFLLGGIAAALMIPAPAWFLAVDLLLAYIPMALLGWKLSGRG